MKQRLSQSAQRVIDTQRITHYMATEVLNAPHIEGDILIEIVIDPRTGEHYGTHHISEAEFMRRYGGIPGWLRLRFGHDSALDAWRRRGVLP